MVMSKGVLVIVVVAQSSITAVALADICHWISGSGYWDETANWSCGHLPQASDDAYIGDGGVAQIRYGAQCRWLCLAYSANESGHLQFASNAGQSSMDKQSIGYRGTGTLTQSGGWNGVNWDITLGAEAGSSGTYSMTGGRLDTKYLIIGSNGAGWFELNHTACEVNIASGLTFGADSRFFAAPGTTIHMVGGAAGLGSMIDNWNTDASDLMGLEHLELVVENGYAATFYEVASAPGNGFSANFSLGALTLGGAATAHVNLLDSTDNGHRICGHECLFVSQLSINDGSSLDVGGLKLYVAGDVEAQLDAWIDAGMIIDTTLAGSTYPEAVHDAPHGWTLVSAVTPGDMNCDGAVDFGDINPFVLALTDSSHYPDYYPCCNVYNADMDADGAVNFGDINPFVALLSGGARN
jgi:hypothetical protein